MYAKLQKMLIPSHILNTNRQQAVLAAFGIDHPVDPNKPHENDWIAYRMLSALQCSSTDICLPVPYGVFDDQYGFFLLADAIALSSELRGSHC